MTCKDCRPEVSYEYVEGRAVGLVDTGYVEFCPHHEAKLEMADEIADQIQRYPYDAVRHNYWLARYRALKEG